MTKDLRCAKCGIALGDVRLIYQHFNIPGACSDHIVEVLLEAAKDYGMWPSDWYGHWSITETGQWMPSIPLLPDQLTALIDAYETKGGGSISSIALAGYVAKHRAEILAALNKESTS